MRGRVKRLKEEPAASDQELFTLKPTETSTALKENASAFLRNAEILDAIYGRPPAKKPVMKKEEIFHCYKDTGDEEDKSSKLKRKQPSESSDEEESLDEEEENHMLKCLSQAVAMYYDASRPGEQVLGLRRNFFADLTTQTRNLFPECELVLFGSSVTGLAEAESDLDVCLLTPDPDTDSPLEFLGRLQRVIRKIAKVNFIKSATVPILACVRYHKKATFEFDISCNKPEGLWNAQIVKHFIDLDSRIAPCLFYLHKLLNITGIKNSKCALLSSFSINISFLSYLQHTSSLPRVRWQISNNGEMLVNYVQFDSDKGTKSAAKCHKSEGELIVGYLKWLAEEINSSGTRYMDIRHPDEQDKNVARPVKNMGFGIINPTIPTHDVTRNIGDKQWKIILSGIYSILRQLKEGVTSPADAHPLRLGPAAAANAKGAKPPSKKKKAKRVDYRSKNKKRKQQSNHVRSNGNGKPAAMHKKPGRMRKNRKS
eukprot:TRINITY_DN15495_c0_g1_i2.p1 TRINITY_DN15495_c0_g1~~TRINITY_DN15495_c0_g1_i2.p1  ORF type:complete len:484 (+),score=52.68 TRINITY_DN15495_c0_g1_i2:35-1486(+)